MAVALGRKVLQGRFDPGQIVDLAVHILNLGKDPLLDVRPGGIWGSCLRVNSSLISFRVKPSALARLMNRSRATSSLGYTR
jgi:hypothetical protein